MFQIIRRRPAANAAWLAPFVIALPLGAFAQSDNTADQALEEIIVTGTHIKGLNEEVLPVTVMNDEQMKALGAVNMLDILGYIPSISDFEFEDTNTATNGARGDVAVSCTSTPTATPPRSSNEPKSWRTSPTPLAVTPVVRAPTDQSSVPGGVPF